MNQDSTNRTQRNNERLLQNILIFKLQGLRVVSASILLKIVTGIYLAIPTFINSKLIALSLYESPQTMLMFPVFFFGMILICLAIQQGQQFQQHNVRVIILFLVLGVSVAVYLFAVLSNVWLLYCILLVAGVLVGVLEGIPWVHSLSYFSLQKDLLSETYQLFQVVGAVMLVGSSQSWPLIGVIALLASCIYDTSRESMSEQMVDLDLLASLHELQPNINTVEIDNVFSQALNMKRRDILCKFGISKRIMLFSIFAPIACYYELQYCPLNPMSLMLLAVSRKLINYSTKRLCWSQYVSLIYILQIVFGAMAILFQVHGLYLTLLQAYIPAFTLYFNKIYGSQVTQQVFTFFLWLLVVSCLLSTLVRLYVPFEYSLFIVASLLLLILEFSCYVKKKRILRK